MGLVSAITIDRNDVWKGSSYLAYGNLASFPGELESVINPTTYALANGLTALAPTNEDGVSISRSTESEDGIPIDQKNYNLDEGDPGDTAMEVGTTLLTSNVDVIKIVWGTPDEVAVSGSLVNQKRLPLNAPSTYTERQVYVIQEDAKTGRLRVFAFRKTVPNVDSEMNIQRSEATGLPSAFKLRPDTTLADHHGPYGFIFEEDEAA